MTVFLASRAFKFPTIQRLSILELRVNPIPSTSRSFFSTPKMGSVDTSLHKYTSGRAAKYAASHSSPDPLILYGGWFCPFVQRSWITLHEKRIPHQYFEINPYHKDPEFLRLNPRGLVPTLAVPVDKAGETQKPLYESQVICEYLDEVYDDQEQNGSDLLPRGKQEAYLRARCRLWIDHISTRIIPVFYRFIQHTEAKSYSLDEVRQEFLGHIKTFARQLDPEGPFFLGQRFSMVEVMLAPWLYRMFLFDVYKGGVGIPEEGKGGEDEALWIRWRVFAKAVQERESILDTLSDRAQYVDVYKRYAEDATQSQVGKATRAGRSLP